MDFSLSEESHLSLGLEDDEVHPRRFLRLGTNLLAYGGDNGNVSCFRSGNTANGEFLIVQRYDDGVRAMTVSKDGKRLAVGFETGETRVYAFDDYDINDKSKFHPYIEKAMSRKSTEVDGDTDNNLLQSQDVDDSLEDESFLGPEFSSPIRDLLFLEQTEQGDYRMVVASEEGMCIVNASNFEKMSNSPHLLARESKEHHDNGGIRGLALFGGTLASLAMDGRLCLWDVEEYKLLVRETLTCISKKDVGEIHDADAYDRSCRPLLFSGSDTSMVVVTPGNLKPFLRLWNNDKKEEQEFEPSAFDEAGIGHIEPIVAMLVCSNNWIVSSGRDNRLVVWRCRNEKDAVLDRKWIAVHRFELKSPATDLYMMDNKLIAACSNGNCQLLDAKPFSDGKKGSSTPTSVLKSKSMDAPSDEDEDIDFGSSEEPKSNKGVRFVDDEADEDDGQNADVAGGGDDSRQLDAFEKSENNINHNDSIEDLIDTHHEMVPSLYSRMRRKVEPQESFSPSETFPDNENEVRRFFCWNHIGSATILEGEEDVNTVDIHFTDSAFKKSISFTDGVGLIIGSIGEEGGIFASGLQNGDDEDDVGNDMEDFGGWNMSEHTKAAVRRDQKRNKKGSDNGEPKGSQVLFYKYESLENKRFPIWSINLPDGEEVVGASCGIGWSAVATSRRFVRFFSSGGAQAEIVWLKGEPVTMVGRDRFMAIFYHDSQPLDDGTQQLGYTLWDASGFRVVAQGSVSCLSKGAKLTWVGFSNELSLFAMDSDGMVSMLVAAGDCTSIGAPLWEWCPVLDTVGLRKSKDDSYWPITVVNGKLVSIPLKGGKKYPDASRRPVTTTLGFRMPLSRSGFKNHMDLEEASVRANLALSQKKLINELDGEMYDESDEYRALCTDVDKVTLKLIYNKICDGQLDAALGLVARLHLEETFTIAIKMADRFRHNKLSDYIEEEMLRRFPPSDGEDDGYDDNDAHHDDVYTDDRFDKLSGSSQISPEAQPKRAVQSEDGIAVISKKRRYD
ncbi:minichromosome loss protein Mcl1 related protein [Nitzschia inconspicua]|uniref:Minichromosome loss protein Mcl1 related protein n=1 Tax=Nitzschia inconspicua TaxID=303405 RepID=A0A9K3L7M7_9STRA|nr:minichromosome loss protein Mcl1 related protein [Nitzschia inconspicua]